MGFASNTTLIPMPRRRKTPLGMGASGGNFKLKNATVKPQPGDGSCLFHSLAYGLADGHSASQLRREIAQFVANNPNLEIAETPMHECKAAPRNPKRTPHPLCTPKSTPCPLCLPTLDPKIYTLPSLYPKIYNLGQNTEPRMTHGCGAYLPVCQHLMRHREARFTSLVSHTSFVKCASNARCVLCVVEI